MASAQRGVQASGGLQACEGSRASGADREDPYRLLAESVETILWSLDVRSGALYLNPAYEAITGHPRDVAIEKPVTILHITDAAHREDLARDLARLEPFQRIVRITRPDGQPRWLRLRGKPVRDPAGRTTHLTGTGEDFTERRAKGRAVRKARDAYRALAENVTDLISRHGLDGRLLYASPSMKNVLGHDVRTTLGASPRLWLDEDQIPVLEEFGERLLASDAPETVELRVRHADGRQRWLQSSCRILEDEAGRPTEVLAVSRDVTEQLEAAAALAESEERFRQLAENIHQVFWLVDLCNGGQVVYVSPAYEAVWGRKPEAVGTQSFRWIESLHPEDRERVWKAFDENARLGNFDVEYRVVRPDGAVRWIHDRGFPIRDERGEVYRVAGIAEDVTERRRAREELLESEERFSQLAQHVGGMFWLCDWKTGRMIYQTPELESLGGGTGELVDDPWSWLPRVHPEDREIALAGIERLSSEGSLDASYRVFHENGEVRWVRSRAFVIRDADGAILRTAGLLEDVTERRQLQARVQQTQKLESLGVLAGGIAHDFNNLLTGVLGNASMALEQLPADAPARAMVHEIDQAARRAASLCTQMLAYAGRAELETELINLNEVVRGIIPLLQTSLSGTHLNRSLVEGLPAIRGDASQLGQIVLNLITNAAESMQGRTGTIRVRTGHQFADAATLRESYLKEELPAGEYVWFEVLDSGCGMDAETQRKIFEPFFTTKFTGRGLGLAAVLGIVRGHGGAVFLESEPDRGTRFRILLPATTAVVNAAQANEATPSDGRNRTILVVDDQETVRRLVERVLLGAGYRVISAPDGVEGLVQYHRHGSDVDGVLLDLTMPGMDGGAVLEALRRRAPDLPVVLMSGYTEDEVSETIRALGYSGFVHKPFTGSSLRSELDRAMPGNAEPGQGP